MKRSPTLRDVLPLAAGAKVAPGDPTGDGFDPRWIDFERGIRVGNLQPHERITQILKYRLEQRHGTRFITDRWGRGVYWQWICWLPVANREAKPISHGVNFGCAKLFISADRQERVLQFGLQVERGFVKADRGAGWRLARDWDWHLLMRLCAKGTALDAELRRLLVREGFVAAIVGGGGEARLDRRTFRSAAQLRTAAQRCPAGDWAGFQLYYPMPEAEVRACSGRELVEAVVAGFAEVTPAMNLCMQVPLAEPQRVHG